MPSTGAAKGTEETPGHVVPGAENAEAGDKHARTEDIKPSGSPKKGSKKAKTELGDIIKDNKAEKADTGAAKGVDSAGGDAVKPSSPTKSAAVNKEAQPSSPVKAAPSSPKKAAASSPKKQAAEKVESATKKV